MNTLEDRVRAAARAAAATVAEGSAPPLRLPQSGRRPGPLGWDGRHPWIVPLAAAAAVIVLIAASIFAAHAVVPGTRRPAPLSTPLPRLADGLPAYFLEYSISDRVGPEPRTASEGSPPIPSRLRSHETLHVVATATGKVATTASLPGYVTAIAASGGAFFAAVVKDNLARFYEVRLTDRRTATTVTELPIRPDGAPLAFMTVSPDGTKLAYSTLAMHGAFGEVQNLVVASTAEGSQREWLTPPQDSRGSMGSMSWLADGRTLAFNWTASAETPSTTSLRLLDTTAPGSDLMAGRAVLPSVYGARTFSNHTTVLSPNGQVVVGSASGSAASRPPEDSVLAFSTATGKETVLYRASPNGEYGTGCYSPPVWISNAGSEVLVTCFQGKGVKAKVMRYALNIVLINHGHSTVLPWLSGIADAAWVTAFP
jgi:hypothetical protein